MRGFFMGQLQDSAVEFRRAFGNANISVTGEDNEENNRIFRLHESFIAEEYQEVMVACFDWKKKPFNQAATESLLKELGDLVYVCYQMAACLGLDLDHAMQLIHESNMTKLGDDGKPFRDEAGKVQKGPNYVKPDLSEIVQQSLEFMIVSPD
jgi:hypothetical protein